MFWVEDIKGRNGRRLERGDIIEGRRGGWERKEKEGNTWEEKGGEGGRERRKGEKEGRKEEEEEARKGKRGGEDEIGNRTRRKKGRKERRERKRGRRRRRREGSIFLYRPSVWPSGHLRSLPDHVTRPRMPANRNAASRSFSANDRPENLKHVLTCLNRIQSRFSIFQR